MASTSEGLTAGAGMALHAKRTGWLWGWITVVDHKRIGQLYLVSSLFFFVLGGIEAFFIRLQLWSPTQHVLTAVLFNQFFTMHGTTMIFLAVMPATVGFANAVMPLMIGARDVAYPRLNALSMWLFIGGGLMLYTSWFLGGAPDAGWFNYAPISSLPFSPSRGVTFYDVSLQIVGIGTLMTAINFLVTVANLRAPGMTPLRLPLFVWTWIVTFVLILFAFPPLTVDLFLQTFDRVFGAQFFSVASGAPPLLWANLFWIFGHPEVYILVLPAFGTISEVVATFSRKPLFGYRSMVAATLAIGFLSFMVWVHHMFDLGFGPWVNSIFAVSSMLIAIPTGVKIFNWLSTMWGGDLWFEVPMLWVVGFLVCFTIGGMSGVMLASAPADFQYNNSYFLVAHFHYVLIGGTVFALFAATHYWFPKMTGRMMNETMGKWQFWLVFIGFNVTFFPMHWLGLMGMPRRIYTYIPGEHLQLWNQVCTVGVCILALGVLLFIVNVVQSTYHGALASSDPWDGRTLEWAIPSPPPEYNFARLPLVEALDPWWYVKQKGEYQMPPAPGPHHGEHHGKIHMPTPTPLPFYLACSVVVAGYGLVFASRTVAIIGFLLLAIFLQRSMFTYDEGILVNPEEVGQHG